MYKSRTDMLIAPAFNEEGKSGEVVRWTPRNIVDAILVVDGGSTHGAATATVGWPSSQPIVILSPGLSQSFAIADLLRRHVPGVSLLGYPLPGEPPARGVARGGPSIGTSGWGKVNRRSRPARRS
jgi:hypothetical protein